MIKKIIIALIVIILIFLVILGGRYFSGSGISGSNSVSTSPGIYPDRIVLGSSSALSGFASFLGTEYQRGADTYFKKVNATGGVNGRRIEVISYDDAYDPAKTIANTQKLIKEDKVFALFNYVGTPTTVKVMPIVSEERIPLVGLFTGANAFRDPINPYIFNIRASYYQEVGEFVRGMVEELDIKDIAVFYQYDAFGLDGLKGAQIALAKYNLKPVAEESYVRGTLDVEAGLAKIKASKAHAVVMIGTYSPMAKFIKLAKGGGYEPLFQNVSFVGSEAFAKELGAVGNGVVVTEVVPPPYERNLLTGVDEYTKLIKQYYPDGAPSFGSLEGYINAAVMVEALKRAGKDLTRDKLVTSLESIENLGLGLASPVSFSSTNHQAMSHVYPTYIKDGKFVLFSDWKDLNK